MEKELGKEILDEKERKIFLSDNADGIEETSYMKRFTPEELVKMKELLSDVLIQINTIKQEKKDVVEGFKEQLKPLSKQMGELLKGLKNKSTLVIEDCYKFVDHENRTVHLYNSAGDLIVSRPAFGNELQTNIFKNSNQKVS